MAKIHKICGLSRAPEGRLLDPRVKNQVFLGPVTSSLMGVLAIFTASCAAPEPVDPMASGTGTTGETASTQSGSRFGPGYPPGSAAWSPDARAAYRTAFMAGLQDQREGYRYDEDRGAMLAEEHVRVFYRKGYRRGYYHDAAVQRTRQQAADEEALAPDGSLDRTGPANTDLNPTREP